MILQNARPALLHFCPGFFRLFAFFSLSTLAEVFPLLIYLSHRAPSTLVSRIFYSPSTFPYREEHRLPVLPTPQCGKDCSAGWPSPWPACFFLVKVCEEAVLGRVATLSDAGTSGRTPLHCRLHTRHLSSTEGSDQVVIRATKCQDQCRNLLYLYSFNKGDEVPKMLSDFHTCGLYAWDIAQ